MLFFGVVMATELIEEGVGLGQRGDVLGGGKFTSAKAPQDITDKGHGETGAKLRLSNFDRTATQNDSSVYCPHVWVSRAFDPRVFFAPYFTGWRLGSILEMPVPALSSAI